MRKKTKRKRAVKKKMLLAIRSGMPGVRDKRDISRFLSQSHGGLSIN